jgi:hypothetical protein
LVYLKPALSLIKSLQVTGRYNSVEAERLIQHPEGLFVNGVRGETEIGGISKCEVSDEELCDGDDKFHWDPKTGLSKR